MSDQTPHENEDRPLNVKPKLFDRPEPPQRKKKTNTAMIVVLSILGVLVMGSLLALLTLYVLCSGSSW